LINTASAAPPSVSYLLPAGGQRGSIVEVNAAGTFERWPVQGTASDPGISVKAGKDKGKLSITIAASVESGRHWLWLHDEQGASLPQPFLVGTLPEIRESEPNNDAKSAQKVTLPVVVNGRLEKPNDVDCYAVSLKKGQTLVAAFEGWATLRSPLDAVLQIVSPDGFVVAENNDSHGLDPFIDFVAPKDGVYIVRTFAFPAVPDTTIRFSGGENFVYRLTLTTGSYADYVFPLAVEREKPGVVEMVGWNIPDAARRIAVRPAAEKEWIEVAHLDVANAFRIRVEPHTCLQKRDGDMPLMLEPPVTVTGRLGRPKANDRFVVRAKKGQALVIRAESQSLGLPVTPVIRIADTAGHPIAGTEPGDLHGDAALTFVPPADGDYLLSIRDKYEYAGPRLVYLLYVAPPRPDFALSVAAERFTVAAGTTVDLPLTVQRLNGFSNEIDLVTEGLPIGVSAKTEPVKDPGRLTLKFTTTADAKVSGPFRVVGRAKTGTPYVHAATATLPAPFDGAPAVRIEYLWLTITRPMGK
jgi:hypothetical protein